MPKPKKMLLNRIMTEKTIEASRRNGKKSKGPVTPRGRAVSSQNRRTFDLLPFENPALPKQLNAQYYAHYLPSTKAERQLVDALVEAERVQRHCAYLESRVWNEEMEEFNSLTRESAADGSPVHSIADVHVAVARRLMMVRARLEASQSRYRNACRQLDSMREKIAA